MRIENFPKLKRCDHSPKRDEFIDVSSDPSYFSLDSPVNVFYFIHNCLCVLGESMTPHPSFPPDLFLYVNLGAKGAQKLFKTLAPQLTVLGIPHFR
jgi:hypothetical protein